MQNNQDGTFRIYFAKTADANLLIDGNGIVDANDAAVALLRYADRDALMKRNTADLWPENQPDGMNSSEKAAAIFRSALSDGSSRFEFVHRRADGTDLPMEVLLTSIPLGGKELLLATLRDISGYKKAEAKLRLSFQRNFQRMQKAMEETIGAMATIVGTRDPFTADHQRRVTHLVTAIAEELRLFEDQKRCVHLAAVIHDIGKMYIPAELLSKPGKLSNIEYSFMRTHAEAGYDILKSVDLPYPIALVIYEHHERMDGSGYPQGLKGRRIMLEARILAVADVVEAMCSHRPYRPSLGIDKALEEIADNKGILYDETVVDVCIRLFKEKGYEFP